MGSKDLDSVVAGLFETFSAEDILDAVSSRIENNFISRILSQLKEYSSSEDALKEAIILEKVITCFSPELTQKLDFANNSIPAIFTAIESPVHSDEYLITYVNQSFKDLFKIIDIGEIIGMPVHPPKFWPKNLQYSIEGVHQRELFKKEYYEKLKIDGAFTIMVDNEGDNLPVLLFAAPNNCNQQKGMQGMVVPYHSGLINQKRFSGLAYISTAYEECNKIFRGIPDYKRWIERSLRWIKEWLNADSVLFFDYDYNEKRYSLSNKTGQCFLDPVVITAESIPNSRFVLDYIKKVGKILSIDGKIIERKEDIDCADKILNKLSSCDLSGTHFTAKDLALRTSLRSIDQNKYIFNEDTSERNISFECLGEDYSFLFGDINNLFGIAVQTFPDDKHTKGIILALNPKIDKVPKDIGKLSIPRETIGAVEDYLTNYYSDPSNIGWIVDKFGKISMGCGDNITDRLIQARQKIDLEDLANRDSRTKLINFRFYSEIADVRFSSMKKELFNLNQKRQLGRKYDNFCYILLDIDDFSSINTDLLYDGADKILLEMSDILRNNMRESDDLLARFAGDEFIITWYNISKEDAERKAKNLHESIVKGITEKYNEIYPIINQTEPLRKLVTISMGCVYLDSESLPRYEQMKDIQNEASRLLKQAKDQGKNRFYFLDS